MKNCLLCGVGGQGTVLASRIIAQTELNRGGAARTAETIGMAQRGGCVVSHVRMGGDVFSPLIPLGGADVLLGFEPGEAVRCISYLKPGGTAIVSPAVVQPVSLSLSGRSLDGGEMLGYLKKKCAALYTVDTENICRACGSPKVQNVALLGGLIASGTLGITEQEVADVLRTRLPAKIIDMNLKALHLGIENAVRV